MKYIRYSRGGFILFSRNFIHSDVARAVPYSGGGPPLSAGSIAVDDSGRYLCQGGSESLGLLADPGDTELLAAFLASTPKAKP